MTIDRQHAALVALVRRLKPRRAADALDDHDGDPVAALVSTAEEQLSLVADSDQDPETWIGDARRDLEVWGDEGADIVTVFDDAYPPNLRTVHDRPLLLFVAGALEERDARSVAVVGTRKPTERGLRQAGEIAGELADAGYVVASGLAAGIDTAAHQGALKAGGRTVAVIGTGLRHTFPKSNAHLQRHLCEETAVLSQFWPDQGPRPYTFPMRNAVMSGLARATVVVEASYTSGAKTQARLALEHGRPVVLMRSLLEHEWARVYAGRPGVYVVDHVTEIVAHLDELYSANLTLAL